MLIFFIGLILPRIKWVKVKEIGHKRSTFDLLKPYLSTAQVIGERFPLLWAQEPRKAVKNTGKRLKWRRKRLVRIN